MNDESLRLPNSFAGGEVVACPGNGLRSGRGRFNEEAVRNIFKVKGGRRTIPSSCNIRQSQWDSWRRRFRSGQKANRALLAGPLTLILKKKPQVPTASRRIFQRWLCVSVPSRGGALLKSRIFIAAPTRTSGRPSTTTAQHVLDDHAGKFP